MSVPNDKELFVVLLVALVSKRLGPVLNVVPPSSVPVFPEIDRSVKDVPEPGYDFVLAASKARTNPSSTILGPVNISYSPNLDLIAL